MAVKPVLVCDVCGRDGDSAVYTVVYPDGVKWELDLCGRHAGPLQKFRDDGVGREVRPRGRRKVFELTSFEEIKEQAAKKQTRGRKRP